MNRAATALAIIAIVTFGTSLVIAQQTPQTSQEAAAQAQATSSTVTEISADRGSCKVEFKVTNLTGQPIYNAKIHTQVRWGLAHKLDLDAATNADGRARFINMPNTVKKPLIFNLTNGADEAMLTWDPGTNCQAEYTVPLAKKGVATSKQ